MLLAIRFELEIHAAIQGPTIVAFRAITRPTRSCYVYMPLNYALCSARAQVKGIVTLEIGPNVRRAAPVTPNAPLSLPIPTLTLETTSSSSFL